MFRIPLWLTGILIFCCIFNKTIHAQTTNKLLQDTASIDISRYFYSEAQKKKHHKQYLSALNFYLKSIQTDNIQKIHNTAEQKLTFTIYLEALQLLDSLKYSKGNIDYQVLLKRYFHLLYENGMELAYTLYSREHHAFFINAALWLIEKFQNHLFYESRKNYLLSLYFKYNQQAFAQIKSLSEKIFLIRQKIDHLQTHNINPNLLSQLTDSLYKIQRQSDSLMFSVHQRISKLTNTTSEILLPEYNNNFKPDKDVCYVVFFCGSKNIYSIAFNNTKKTFHRIPADSLIFSNIHCIKSSLMKSDVLKFSISAYNLYEQLLKPFEPLFNHKIILTIIPDGYLHQIPFDCLLTQPETNSTFKKAHYLINTIQVNTFPSVTALLHSENKTTIITDGSLDYFSPVFDNNIKKYYYNLPVSSNDSLYKHLPELRFSKRLPSELKKSIMLHHFEGFEANKNNFTRLLNNQGIMHLATHAFFNDTNILDSYIAFAPEKNSKYKPYISLSEIFTTIIKKNLIILGSCETGRGIYDKGFGNLSFSQAFYIAGCQNLIFTLWPVDDKNTSTIFRYFYEELAKEKSSTDALHQSKIRFLSECNEIDANPINWAGYVHSGNPVLYDDTSDTTYIIWFIVFAVLFISTGYFTRKKIFRKFYSEKNS